MLAAALLALGGSGTPLESQSMDLLSRPLSDWDLRLDREGGGVPPSAESEEEGLRILTGAAGVFYLPDVELAGSYEIEVTFTQFDPGGRREGYGLIVGGRDLATAEQAYIYFLFRQDGQTLVKQRLGERTPVIRDWAETEALARWDDRPQSDDTITNVMKVSVKDGQATWYVNGEQDFSHEVADTADGLVGIRVNHGVHIRVDDFRVTHMN